MASAEDDRSLSAESVLSHEHGPVEPVEMPGQAVEGMEVPSEAADGEGSGAEVASAASAASAASEGARSLREPLEGTRVATLECQWSGQYDLGVSEDERPTLLHFRCPVGNVSWSLALRWGDSDNEEDSALKLLLCDVRADRTDNLCVEVQARVYRNRDKVATLKKLFNADGVLDLLIETVEIHSISFKTRINTYYRNAPCAACGDWARFRECTELAEVTFALGEVAIRAHKQVLCARSPVFKSMFTLDFKERKELQVSVEGVTPQVFAKFLEFLYSSQVDSFDGLELDLMLVADRYQVEALKVLCQREMFDKIGADNVLEILVLADSVNAAMLKKNALAVAVAKIGVVMASAAWKDFHAQHNELVDDILKEAILRNVSVTTV